MTTGPGPDGTPEPPVVLTIAGSDSGAGAGVQADLKSVAALGGFAVTAVTAVTAQNTRAVSAVHPVPTAVVAAQIEAVLGDMPVRATKTGMLATVETISLVTDLARAGRLPSLVVDPVLVASTGRPLLDGAGIHAMRRLAGSALVVTPNLWEAALLAGADIAELAGVDAMAEAAARIHGFGARWVLVKGGHLSGVGPGAGPAPALVPDVLVGESGTHVLEAAHVATDNVHGTGCSLSAAIATGLARRAADGGDPGTAVLEAVEDAKRFVHQALTGAARWHLGAGHGPLDHLGRLWGYGPAGRGADHPAAPDGAPAGDGARGA